MILNLNDATLYLFTTTAVITSCTQVLAGVYVTSRFIFALARDFGIPFSTILFKTTKGREPWVVDIVIILSLFASLAGWYVNQSIYFNMISSFLLFFMVVP
jgi:amino acid transporter